MTDLETLAREWLDNGLAGNIGSEGEVTSLAALLRSRDEARDKAWKDRGHSDSRGGCFYTRTNWEEQQRALRIVESVLNDTPMCGGLMDEIKRRLEEVAGGGDD